MDQKLVMELVRFRKRHPLFEQSVVPLMKILTAWFFIIYVVHIYYMMICHDSRIYLFISVPAGVFVLVSILRLLFNRPRPFETMIIDALVTHEKGKSYPSRHTASAFIIAMAVSSISPLLGVPSLIFAACIGILRVISGIHYPTDVMAGAVISMFIGSIAFF